MVGTYKSLGHIHCIQYIGVRDIEDQLYILVMIAGCGGWRQWDHRNSGGVDRGKRVRVPSPRQELGGSLPAQHCVTTGSDQGLQRWALKLVHKSTVGHREILQLIHCWGTGIFFIYGYIYIRLNFYTVETLEFIWYMDTFTSHQVFTFSLHVDDVFIKNKLFLHEITS